jgi:hypothetical protein
MTAHSDSSLMHSPQHPIVYKITYMHSTTASDADSSFSLTCGQTPENLDVVQDLFQTHINVCYKTGTHNDERDIQLTSPM